MVVQSRSLDRIIAMPEIAPKLYTVTRDVEMLVQRWCRTRPEGQLAFPPSDVFKELSDQLTAALIAVFAEEAKKYQNYPAFEEKRERGEWSRTEVEFISPEQIRKIISKRDSPILSEIANGWRGMSGARRYGEAGQGLDENNFLAISGVQRNPGQTARDLPWITLDRAY